ncbi:MarR family winged helix-turn-helix transcriptional regulator [Parapedobacter deserti]|uniref:MarR family winged helix-turn-helix transcriptional regulator n=1 Tax=Parapedobacter deserti TaxID=1912957 RepID=A0ABV7JVJ3_9SPHI
MRPIVELISEWDTYVSSHDGVTVEEFCKYYLTKKSVGERRKAFAGMTPPDLDTTLAKLIGRVASMYSAYCKMALQEKPEIDLDSFYFLNAIYHKAESQKKEIIQFHFVERSTGMDILKRLLISGYITERADPVDKRAKLVSITKKGERTLHELYRLLFKPTVLMFHSIPEEEKKLLADILTPVEIKHGEILSKSKTQHLDEILKDEVGEHVLRNIYAELGKRINQFTENKSSQ